MAKMNSMVKVSVMRTIVAIVLSTTGFCLAQVRSRPEFDPRSDLSGNLVRLEGGLVVNEDELHTAREIDTHSAGKSTLVPIEIGTPDLG